jgi:hypothetical protein
MVIHHKTWDYKKQFKLGYNVIFVILNLVFILILWKKNDYFDVYLFFPHSKGIAEPGIDGGGVTREFLTEVLKKGFGLYKSLVCSLMSSKCFLVFLTT